MIATQHVDGADPVLLVVESVDDLVGAPEGPLWPCDYLIDLAVVGDQSEPLPPWLRDKEPPSTEGALARAALDNSFSHQSAE